MLYTLSTWAVWLLGAAAVGIVIGWVLRGRRGASTRGAAAEQDGQSRSRFDSLEVVANERDRLRAELLELRRSNAAKVTPARQVAPPPPAAPKEGRIVARRPVAAVGEATGEQAALAAERDRLAAALAKRENAIRELRVRLWNDEVRISELEDRLSGRSVTEG